jgi:hypothetical protein
MRKTRIIGFFSFTIGYIGSSKWGEGGGDSTNGCFRLQMSLGTNKTFIIIPFMYLTIRTKIEAIKNAVQNVGSC